MLWQILSFSCLVLSVRKGNLKCLITCYVWLFFFPKDDLTLCSGTKDGPVAGCPSPSIRTIRGDVCGPCTIRPSETQSYTESALKELYQQVSNMPESAKKKKLIRQVAIYQLAHPFIKRKNIQINYSAQLLRVHVFNFLCAVWKAAFADTFSGLPDAIQP